MKKLIMSLVVILMVVGCTKQEITTTPQQEKQTTFITISSEEAQERFEKESDYIILDVRTIQEYEEGHLPNALNIPNETISESIKEQLPDLNQTIYIYCRSGNRSKQAANKLVQIGYQNVIDFGGIQTWKGEIVEGK